MTLVHTINRSGKTIQVNECQLTPIIKSTRVQPPGMWGVLFWHRPSAVVVQRPNGMDEVIPIQDPTRKAQLLLLGIGLVGSLLIAMYYQLTHERKENHD
jgi:hypothetical protein